VIKPVGPSHTPEDLAIYMPQEKVLFAGDLVFRNRLPFVGQADSNHWIKALDELLVFDMAVVVPGHGPVSHAAVQDMQVTRAYLMHLRATMGKAARNLDPFDEAYDSADWTQFDQLPMFRFINRMNAYNTYLLMERDSQ
jgi:glyoxylase-like metal-dependent hydrolase (beta-lactamase superfamily II)